MAVARAADALHATAPSVVLLAGLAGGCAGPAPPAPAPTPQAGVLRVSLVFGEDADLDLYVTDPAQETVYYGNTPSRATGGLLEADLGCDAPAPRVETVRFEAPQPGRYRVGVDHAERCRPGRAAARFRILVEDAGGRLEREGEIALGEFRPAVLVLER
jgi:hypothetical protein